MDFDNTSVQAGDGARAMDSIHVELDRTREESRTYMRQLSQRNRELAAIAAVAEAVSAGEMGLSTTLERALEVVLEVTGLTVGWILLLPEGRREPVMSSSQPLPEDTVATLARYRRVECACRKTVESLRPLVVYPLHPGCAVGKLDLGDGRAPTCHATVPLLARSKVLGVLNLAGDDPGLFDEQETTLLSAIGRQLGVAIENARLLDELKQRDVLRGQLLEQAIATQEDERRHIARELHDQIGQALTSILVWLRALESETNGAAELRIGPHRLQELKAIVADTLDGVRDLAVELRPSVLDDLGLMPAVQRIVRTYQERYHLAIDLHTAGLEGARLLQPVETALYRIVQEALTNVVKHADAHSVSVLFEVRRAEPRSLIVIVEDDGRGFEAGTRVHTEMEEHWLGLSGMRERAELLGGQLTIESSPGTGTTVFVEVPLE